MVKAQVRVGNKYTNTHGFPFRAPLLEKYIPELTRMKMKKYKFKISPLQFQKTGVFFFCETVYNIYYGLMYSWSGLQVGRFDIYEYSSTLIV